MALPLQTLTFYRMPDQTPAAATISAVLDAIYAGWSSAVDYRGTAIPSTHAWTSITKQGATLAVYGQKPSGSPMSLNPGIIFAGAAAGAPAMASPDTFLANGLMVGIGKNIGAYNAWDAAAPWTSGQWFGYWLAASTAINAVTATIRVYVSQEVVIVDAWSAAASHFLFGAGATIEANSDVSGTTVESDSRLYGVFTNGTTAVVNSFLTTVSATTLLDTSTAFSGQCHHGVFQPGTASRYNIGRSTIFQIAPLNQQTDLAGAFIGTPISMVRSSASLTQNGASMGQFRSVYYGGLLQAGLTRRDGATDLFHVLGADSSIADDAILLRAAA